MKDETLRFALLASGSGSNAEAILRRWHEGRLAAKPVAVLCNTPGAPVLERARRFDVPHFVVDHRDFRSRHDHEEAILEVLEPLEPHCLLLAGYMRVVTETLIDAFHGRWQEDLPGVINIHPADTRAYQGAHGYEYALGLLEKSPQRLTETTITVHFVDNGVDTGPIIAQRPVPIRACDSLDELKSRGLTIEHELYPDCLEFYARRKITISDGNVTIL